MHSTGRKGTVTVCQSWIILRVFWIPIKLVKYIKHSVTWLLIYQVPSHHHQCHSFCFMLRLAWKVKRARKGRTLRIPAIYTSRWRVRTSAVRQEQERRPWYQNQEFKETQGLKTWNGRDSWKVDTSFSMLLCKVRSVAIYLCWAWSSVS